MWECDSYMCLPHLIPSNSLCRSGKDSCSWSSLSRRIRRRSFSKRCGGGGLRDIGQVRRVIPLVWRVRRFGLSDRTSMFQMTEIVWQLLWNRFLFTLEFSPITLLWNCRTRRERDLTTDHTNIWSRPCRAMSWFAVHRSNQRQDRSYQRRSRSCFEDTILQYICWCFLDVLLRSCSDESW